MWTLRQARVAIVVAGCLGTVYTQLTTSAASIEFTRNLGGSGLHIGILGALPTMMLFMQFIAAWIANRLDYRRRLWFWPTLVGRLLLVPVACGPWLQPSIPDSVWMWAFLAVFAVNQGIAHFTTTLWLSWMGDYLPKRGLSGYWGNRQLWMQLSAAVALSLSGLWLWASGVGVRAAFALMVCIGAGLGVIDLCLFVKVEEPRVTRLPEAGLREVLSGPFRHSGFRSFIGFTCFWHFAAMVGAPFISLYLIQHIGMDLFQVLTLWTFSWVGGAISSRWLGRAADKFGNKPVLVLCTLLKPLNMASLLCCPKDPTLALVVLAPLFMIDMALNTGIAIANNGFMLKHSPAANRTMFIAAGTAIAGLVGGVTSILCGAWLAWMGDWSVSVGDWAINGFHVLFSLSLVLRFAASALVSRIQEPQVGTAMQLVTTLVDVGPLRVLRYPVGLYRRLFDREWAAYRPVASEVPRERVVLPRPVAGPVASGRDRAVETAPQAAGMARSA